MAYLDWDEEGMPPLSISKTRSQPNPRTETDVFDGPLRVELRMEPDEAPATFDCSVLAKNQADTSRIGAFFHYINTVDSMLFYKNLPTEYGMQKHLVRITGGIPQPDPNSTGRNEMMKYSFTLYVEEIVKPDAIIDNPLLYIKWGKYSNILDRVVNIHLPEA